MISSSAHRTFRIPSLMASACLASLLAACGGGGGSSSLAAAETTVSGTLIDASTNAAISGATIQIGTTGSSSTASTTSSASGSYTMTVPTSSINTGTTVAVTISKTGYQTCVKYYDGLVSTGGSITGCANLSPIGVGEYFPADGVGPIRLGDGKTTSGDINGKLQTDVSIPSKVIALGAAPANISNYTTFSVRVAIRGLQSSDCAGNSVTVFQGPSADPAAATYAETWKSGMTKVAPVSPASLTNSLANGLDSDYAFTVARSSLVPNANLYVQFVAGACSNSTTADPLDDYEVTNVNGKFN